VSRWRDWGEPDPCLLPDDDTAPQVLSDAVTQVEVQHPDLEPGIVGLEWEKAVIAALRGE